MELADCHRISHAIAPAMEAIANRLVDQPLGGQQEDGERCWWGIQVSAEPPAFIRCRRGDWERLEWHFPSGVLAVADIEVDAVMRGLEALLDKHMRGRARSIEKLESTAQAFRAVRVLVDAANRRRR